MKHHFDKMLDSVEKGTSKRKTKLMQLFFIFIETEMDEWMAEGSFLDRAI